MMSDTEIIEVVVAHAHGKKIQFSYCTINGQDDWNDMLPTHIGWDFRRNKYRIAPEPEHLVSAYCFPKDLHPTPRVGMIKVRQVQLEKGENPLPRKPRDFWITPVKYGLCWVSETETESALWHTREVIG